MRGALIFWHLVLVHFSWGVLILLDSEASRTAVVHVFRAHIGMSAREIGVFLLLSSTSASLPLVFARLRRPVIRPLLMFAHHFAVVLVALGYANVILAGAFPSDEIERTSGFLAAVSMPSIVAAALHGYAILREGRGAWKGGFRLRRWGSLLLLQFGRSRARDTSTKREPDET